MLVAAGDMGRDYEHCLELQKKISDTEDVSCFLIVLVSCFVWFMMLLKRVIFSDRWF